APPPRSALLPYTTLFRSRQVSETPLRVQRAEAVLTALREVGAHRVVDMGCGTGALLVRLQQDRSFTRIVGVDVSARALERAARTDRKSIRLNSSHVSIST